MKSEPREFSDGAEAAYWVERTFAAWRKSLTSAEISALTHYKRSGYREINEALRLGLREEDRVAWAIEAIDTALARFRLPEPVAAFRGFTYSDPECFADQDVYRDAAYFSTSLLSSVAEKFCAGERADEAILGRVLIPGDIRVGAYCGAPDLVDAGSARECEILLPRASEFSVQRVVRHGARWAADLELLVP